MVMNVIWVGIGGFLGAVCRYLSHLGIVKTGILPFFPLSTLLVNLTGCFLIGFLVYLAEARNIFSHEMRLFIFVGLLGGFTTFSTFGGETLNLMRGQMMLAALANIALHIVLGLFFVAAGFGISRLLFR